MRKSGSLPVHLGPPPNTTQCRQLGQALSDSSPKQSFWRGRLGEQDRFDQLLFSIGHMQEIRSVVSDVMRQGGTVQFEYGDVADRVNLEIIGYRDKDLIWLLSVADDSARQNIKLLHPCQRLMIEGEQHFMAMKANQTSIHIGSDDAEEDLANPDSYL